MMLIILLYILPYILCCILGYYEAKKEKTKVKAYLFFILMCLLPLFNLIIAITIIISTIYNIKTVNDFLNKEL